MYIEKRSASPKEKIVQTASLLLRSAGLALILACTPVSGDQHTGKSPKPASKPTPTLVSKDTRARSLQPGISEIYPAQAGSIHSSGEIRVQTTHLRWFNFDQNLGVNPSSIEQSLGYLAQVRAGSPDLQGNFNNRVFTAFMLPKRNMQELAVVLTPTNLTPPPWVQRIRPTLLYRTQDSYWLYIPVPSAQEAQAGIYDHMFTKSEQIAGRELLETLCGGLIDVSAVFQLKPQQPINAAALTAFAKTAVCHTVADTLVWRGLKAPHVLYYEAMEQKNNPADTLHLTFSPYDYANLPANSGLPFSVKSNPKSLL
ncbi:hypothetical protein HYW42_03485 [Candidatus Daviesbacteria bacterium]|nr:hypothetical protein [Candidatus Daviesbacteria bacterium]